MLHAWAQAVEVVTTVLAVGGMGYYIAALLAAFVFLGMRRTRATGGRPGVSVLKSLKGLDPGMLEAFRSHCRQEYAGEYELVFGVSSLEDPAAAAVKELQREFPEREIRLFECAERLGMNGKVSTLAQLVPHARYEYLLINDSDITVGPHYLERVMAEMQRQGAGKREQGPGTRDPSATLRAGSGTEGTRERGSEGARPVGLVTALYRGRMHGTLGSRFESLGMSTDFVPAVLLARWLEGGMRYGLGSTLAVSREALAAVGGLEVLKDHLADDYELGARVYGAGYAVALSREVVETSVPAYRWRGFVEHQLRWYRTVRGARPWGYAGLVFTYGLMWAGLNVVASGLSLVSLWLLAMSFLLRVALAGVVGVNVLGDRQVLGNLWLLPVRDAVAMGVWVAGFAGDTIVWRGERFQVREGKLRRV
ncbi:MAG TPA: glycosyltransferase [Terracidiphilus sp.]|jgi:ceramide glucosyltransferase|nr:glycosyltransferase [Terracidiphilus sp.]